MNKPCSRIKKRPKAKTLSPDGASSFYEEEFKFICEEAIKNGVDVEKIVREMIIKDIIE